jgi:hypothetical protein
MRRSALAAALALVLFLPAAPARAQSLRDGCQPNLLELYLQHCLHAADAAEIMQVRLGLAAAAGNPVPGTASTQGMRLGSMPRMTAGLRVTAAGADIPQVRQVGGTADAGFVIAGLSVDAGVGLFQGLNLLPTVGGFGSVDLLGSVGVLPLPRGSAISSSAPVTWALGARVGVLRESFTAPGVSISAMYRSTGEFAYGDPGLAGDDAHIRLGGNRVTSLRGVVGKRVASIGLTGGVGYDYFGSDALLRVRETPTTTRELRDDDFDQRRAMVFANASLTMLILNVAAEAGWQQGGSAAPGASPQREKGGLFAGLAVRLSI